MGIFATYDNIGDEYRNDKVILKEKLLMEFDYNGELNIEEIYEYMLQKIQGYTLSSYLSHECGISDVPDELEDAIKNHCIIKSLYTSEYILNKYKEKVKVIQIGSRYGSRGYYEYHRQLNEAVRMNTARKSSGESYISNIDFDDEARKRFNNCFTSIYINGKARYLTQTLDIEERGQSYYTSTFIPDYTYYTVLSGRNGTGDKGDACNEIYHLDIDGRINAIVDRYNQYCKDNSGESWNLLKRKLNLFLDPYTKLYSHIYQSNGNNVIDKLLFMYKREMTFHLDLISSYFNLRTEMSDPVRNKKQNEKKCCSLWDNSIIEILYNSYEFNIDAAFSFMEQGLRLPNAFSRSMFMRYFFPYEFEDWRPGIIPYLIDFLFPLYEKTFFILLFETCKKTYKCDDEEALAYANTIIQKFAVENLDALVKNYINDSKCEANSNKPSQASEIVLTWDGEQRKYSNIGEYGDGSKFILNREQLYRDDEYIISRLFISAFYKKDLQKTFKHPLCLNYQPDGMTRLFKSVDDKQRYLAFDYTRYVYTGETTNNMILQPEGDYCPSVPYVPEKPLPYTPAILPD